jgi:alpha-N-acetylglucosaminidase
MSVQCSSTWSKHSCRPTPAADASDTANLEAKARYVWVIGLGSTANATFRLTEVSAYGTPAT